MFLYIKIGLDKPTMRYTSFRVVFDAVAVSAIRCTVGGIRLFISPTVI